MTTLTTDEAPPLGAGDPLLPGFRVRRHLRRATPFDVYEVFSEERRCSCVAKLPRPALAHSERARDMLIREAGHLLDLTHPHLVRAYELVHGPQPALIMETLTGETLKHLIHESGHRLTVQELAIMGGQMTSAIAYLHDKGLVHLDLKPSNIVCEAGKVKVIDLSLTREPGEYGAGIGTRHYLSPEQARGGDLCAAADVWGIGAVMYEAITTDLPFPESMPGDYRQKTVRLRLPDAVADDLPRDLVETIDACLAPVPTDRPSVSEVAAVLGRHI